MVCQFEYIEAVEVGWDLLAWIVIEIERTCLVATYSNIHEITIRLHHYLE